MNAITQKNPSTLERSDFVDLLSGEFAATKGFGVYAFLSFKDIENLYNDFLDNSMPARVFIKIFLRNF